MLRADQYKWKRIGDRLIRILLSIAMLLQMLVIPDSALALDAFAFRGYNSENVTNSTFTYGYSDASINGTTVSFTSAGTGQAIGQIVLNEEGDNDISTSVDLGGLEIDFSTVATTTQEDPLEEGGVGEVDTALAEVKFFGSSGNQTGGVSLSKSAEAGSETLHSGASIPSGTREIYIYLYGTSVSSTNTVVFSDTSLVIHDSSAPSCEVVYDPDWTNQPVAISINAADSDSGLEGIYLNGEWVTRTPPYEMTIDTNGTSFSVYSKDYAGKTSEVQTITINNIDTAAPAAPESLSVSTGDWTNADVSVLVPDLPASSGSPERYVYKIGTGSWSDLPKGYAISDNGISTISVAVEDAAGNRSGFLQATAKIDKLAPVIDTFSSTVSSGSCRVDLTAHDTGASGLRDIRFAEGTQSADYFASNGTIVTDGTFTVNKGGDYTVCVSDNAGNRTLQTKMLSTAPTLLEIDDKIIDEDEPLCLTLSIYDAESARSELSVDVTTDDPTLLPSITLDQNDLLTITPGANLYGGPANVTVTVTDPQGEHVSDSFTVTVNSVNDPPEAKDDGPFTLDEDTPLSIDVLANDSDVEGAELTIQSCGAATNGTTLIVLGKVRYTPNANYVGSDSFTYTVTDGNGGSSTATVTLNVTNVNDAPVAQNDEATCDEDSTVLIPVLVNDSDIDTDVNSEETVTVSDLGTASHGTIKKEGGAIRYTPSENYFGSDTFTYTISDKAGLTSTATVTVSVSPQPDAPIFIDLEDSYTIDEDSSANANEITFSIHDVETPADSMMLQVASATASKIEQNGIHILGLGDTSDEVVLSISPAKDQSGDATLILLLGDGFTTVQRTITIHIKDVNDAPQVEEDTVNFNEDTPFVDISIATLLANDTDIEGDPLSFGEIKTQPSSGSVSKLDEETLRYIPETNFDGETSFTYSVSDGQVTSIATCKLIATGSNDAPTILFDDDTAVTTEDTLSGEISFRISDQETAAKDLLLIAKSGNAELVAPDQIAITNKGDGTGTIRIYPQADANGDVTITLTVSDGVAQSYDTIVLTINPAEDAPVAEDDEVYSLYSGSLTFGVLENDHDVDGDSLSVYSHTATGLPGTLTFDESTQLFTYTPVIGENGDQTFTYTVWDGSEQDTATVTLHVSNETHNPVISPVNSQYVQEDGTISNIAVSVTDEDVGDEFTLEVASSDSSKLPVDESHVTIANNGNGSFTLQFTPVSDCSGSVAVTLTVKDKAQNTDTTSFTLYIIAQNDPPVAHNDAAELDEDTSVQLDLLTNDTDADGDTLRVTSVATPAHGSLSLVNGKITYTPYSNWNGSETLSYSITDGRAGASASVTIVVNRVNDSPVAWNDYVELPNEAQATAASINVIHNDKDLDGDTVHANKITIQPRYGTATINPDGTIKYIRSAASPDANGADSFQYQIIDRSNESDEEARTAVATVYIGVDFVSSLYTYGRSVTCYEDCKPFDFTLDVTNPSNVNYTLTINTVCTLGTLEVVGDTANTIHFTPYENAYGSQNITYTVASTENSERHTGTIWLIVYPVNDLPMIDSAPTEITVQEDASTHASFDVVFHDADCATSGLYFNVYTRSASTEAPVAFSTGFTVQRTGTGSTVTINPDTNVNGSAVIVVGVSDGFAYTEQTISLTITPEDDAPVLSGVSRTIHEDMSVSFAALTSDYEVDGDQTTVSIDTPQHGTAVLRSDKTIQYKPDANYYGTDTFQITVTDKTEAKRSASATVTINIISVNDPPSISGVEYYQTTLEDTVKTIPITVTDVDDDMTASSSYKFVSGDESIVRSEDITISHDSETGKMILSVKPVENAYGSVVIRVTATDSAGVSAKASFLLRITPVNDVPVANNDSATVSEVISTGNESVAPMTITTMNLIENDTDVEGGALSIVAITDVQNGIVTSNGNGTVTISADGDSTKDVTFHYMIMDPGGATASADATLVITPSNDPPRTQEDSYTIDEDEQSTFEVLVNDVDPEEEALSISDVSIPSHGTATISGTSIVFIPAKDYNGTDSFTYTATDASGASAEPTTVRISIRSINDAPEISKHESNSGDWQMTEDTPKSFHFVVSDAESAVKNLIVRIKSLDETLVKTSQIQLSTNEGGYNTILVTPNKDQYGTVPVEFIVSDGLLSTTVTYNILITGANDPPVVTPMDLETDEDTKITKTAVASDVENNPVTFFLSDTPQYGTAAVNADGSFTYTPEKDFNGSDSFVIGANDGQSENSTGTALIRIQVLPANDPPTAVDDTTSTNEDTAVDIDVIANDTDMDLDYGDALTILRIPTAPTKGTAQIVDNKIHYVPSKDLNGTDTFTYEICDQDGKPSTATVTVQITAVNDVPAGGNDTAEVFEDNSVTIDVLANDDVDMTTNPGHEALTITKIATNPSHGTARISDGAIIYTPTENYFSPEDTPDTFTYIVTDSGNLTAEFTVSVNVKAVNDAPTLTVAGGSEQFANVNMDEDTVSSAIAFTVSDVEDAAGSLSVSVTHDNSDLLPTITVTPNAAGECSFVIDSKDNKVGTATITVKVTDSGQLSAVKTFTVDVKQVNDAPIAQDDVKTIPEGGSDSIDVLYNDDVDKLDGNGGDTLTLLSIGTAEFGSPTYGTASIVDNKILYTQTVTTTNKLSYTDVFGYTMKDASGQTSSAKVTVTIRPFNDYPVISSVSNVADLPEDTENGTGDLSFRVSDEEDNDDGLAVTASSSNTKLVPNANIVISNPDAEADSTGQQRTVRIISAKDQFGTAAITLTVRDAEGQKTSTTFTVTVLPVNDAPADGDDVVEVDEDHSIQISVLTNDDVDLVTNPATEHLEVTGIVTNPSHGTVTIPDGNQSIIYKPNDNYFSLSGSPDVFTYAMKDSSGLTAEFTVSVNVKAVNDAPTIDYDGEPKYTVPEGTSVVDIPFYVDDVDNNTNPSLGDLGVTVTAKSSNSVLVKPEGLTIRNGAGKLRYLTVQPYMNWNGTTTIYITAADLDGAKATKSFLLEVTNVNAKPVAVADSITVPEDAVSNLNVLANDTDDDLITNPFTENLYVNFVSTESANATVSIAAGGKSVVFNPIANFNGEVVITYTTKDEAGAVSNSVNSTITVSQVNDAPEPADDAVTVDEDKTIEIAVLSNDWDIDKDEDLNAIPGAEILSASISEDDLLKPSHGKITIENNVITYDSNDNYNGPDTFEYYCSDGETATKAQVTVTVGQINDSPVAVKDTNTVDEDKSVTTDVVANDTDVDTLTGLNVAPDSLNDLKISGEPTVTEGSGTITSHTDRTITFKPSENWFGVATITYTVEDVHEAKGTGTLEITVGSVNDLPVFTSTPATMQLTEDLADGTGTLAVSDVETAKSDLNVTMENSTNTGLVDGSCVTLTEGTDGNWTIAVNPKDNQHGEATITLRVTDKDNGYTEVTFLVAVEAVNDEPVADDKTLNIAEDSENHTILKTDVTHDNDIATDKDELTLTITTQAAHGTASIVDGNIVYRANDNYNGTDSFTYTATDKLLGHDSGTVTVNISQVNDAPEPEDDAVTVDEDKTIEIAVLSNDWDIDKDEDLNAIPGAEILSASISEDDLLKPSHGKITIENNVITYDSNDNYNGPDTFEYYCSDGETATKAQVTVTVGQINDSPVAVKDTNTVDEDKSVTTDVVANDTDVDTLAGLNAAPDSLNDLKISGEPTVAAESGTVTGHTDRTITFKPSDNWFGVATVTYTVEDVHGATSTGTLEITVGSVNDLPVFTTKPANMELTEDLADGTGTLAVSDVETGKSDLNVTVEGSTNTALVDKSCVTLTEGTDGNWTVAVNPKDNQHGEATIKLRVTDKDNGYTEITFLVTVEAVNDEPVADDKTLNIAEDSESHTILKTDVTHDNDIATDKDELTLTITTQAAHGTASIVDGNIVYRANDNYNGTDSFTYTAIDKLLAHDSGTVTVNISQVNDAPEPEDDAVMVDEDKTIEIAVLSNDWDIDKDEDLNAIPGAEILSASISEDDLLKPSHGKITIENNVITYDSNDNYNGPDTFEYYCGDGETATKAQVTVTVGQINDNPVAVKDTNTVDEDKSVTTDVVANDTDVDTLTGLNEAPDSLNDLKISGEPTVTEGSGTITSHTDRTITFKPSENWFGVATITYTVEDVHEAKGTGTLEITVGSVNDLPVFTSTPATMQLKEDLADGTGTLAVSDVETAKSDLNVTMESSTNTGLVDGSCVTLTEGTDGNWTVAVNPKDNQHGEATITLRVTDEDNDYTEITFLVTVEAVNDEPVADDKTLNIAEDSENHTILKTDVTHDNDIATDKDELTLTITTQASHGTASIVDGNIVYRANDNYNGTDSFTYTATDKLPAHDSGTVSVNISQVNDAPEPEDDAVTVDEDKTIEIAVLSNDWDTDKDEDLNAIPGAEILSASISEDDLLKPSHGKATILNNVITYDSNDNYNGTDTFEYYCSDGETATKAQVTVTVGQINDSPVAVADVIDTDEDTAVTYNVLDNDTDVDTEETLNAGSRHLRSTFTITNCSMTGAENGTVSYSGGEITFTPNANYNGNQVIAYQMSDGHGGVSSSTLTVLVASVDDPPVARTDRMFTTEDNAATINVLDNDTDDDVGDTLRFIRFTESIGSQIGTFTTNADGNVTFTPYANYNGEFTIAYEVYDSTNLPATAVLDVTVSEVNDAPVAEDASVTTQEDTEKTINLSAYVSDVDIATNSDTVTLSIESGNGPSYGTAKLNGMVITYTPSADYNGADRIIYTATDSNGEKDSGTIDITITAVNDAPVPANDAVTTKEDVPVTIDVLVNDHDVDSDKTLNAVPDNRMDVDATGTPQHGTVGIQSNKVVYTPDADFNGTDTFTYRVSDGNLTGTASVTVTVTQENDPIIAKDDEASTTDEDPVEIDVLANDTDVDTDKTKNLLTPHSRDAFEITSVGAASHGTTQILNGKIKYTPNDRFAGNDSFTYTVSDGYGTHSTAAVNVTVLSVNDAPIIVSVGSPLKGAKAIPPDPVHVAWEAFDIDGDTLTYSLEYYYAGAWLTIGAGLTTAEYDFVIPASMASTNALQFRVTAFDGQITSDYGYSEAVIVDKDAPAGSAVSMKTADGNAYAAGTWTNQNVIVQAYGSQDVSAVTFYYSMDGGAWEAGESMSVTSGVHTVSVQVKDEFGNTTSLGEYLARVDKLPPAVPQIRESISGGKVAVDFTLLADPGGSGNDFLILPDGSRLGANTKLEYLASGNGTYSFTLIDAVGNRRTFSYAVESADTTKPSITCSSGSYRTGTATRDNIIVTLVFSDTESAISARGYQLSSSASASGAYRTYEGAIHITSAGTYYIHAFARNAFGLTTYATFGPFILERVDLNTAAGTTPTPVPESGSIVITTEDVKDVPQQPVAIRLPGKEWSETLTLEGVSPGEYLIEVMDADGNISTTTVRATARDIIARSLRNKGGAYTAVIAASATAVALLLILLFAGYNVIVTVVSVPFTEEKKVRAIRRIMLQRKEMVINLEEKHVRGGRFAKVKLARFLTKKMRGNWIIVNIKGREVLKEQIPEDANKAFRRKITLD